MSKILKLIGRTKELFQEDIQTYEKELYHILLSLRAHGWTRNLPKENKFCTKSDNWFEESFRFVLPGYNVRPVEMSGAIGIEQLKKLPNFLVKRRENVKLFQELFSNHPDFIIQKDICNSSWFGFSLIINPTSKLKRANVVKRLMDAKIDFRLIFFSFLVSLPYFSTYLFNFETNLVLNLLVVGSFGIYFLGTIYFIYKKGLSYGNS